MRAIAAILDIKNIKRVRYGLAFFIISGLLLITAQCAKTPLRMNDDAPVALIPRPSWPQDKSDLEADPDTLFGKLPNGLRYVVKENQTPRDRVSIHLFVQAGSLSETHREQGLAHFLEHMVFNGSTHFAPGEMVKFFQRIGMQFGPDANAHTGFAQTVFDINLPKGDAENIAEGLMVLRDYAEGALLLEKEVDRERKVILSEMRSRDSAAFRTMKAVFQFEMPGSLVAHRFPIGEIQTLKQVDAQMLRRFYNAWYRPERMFLVMTGAFENATAVALIAETFGDFKPHGETQNAPEFGQVDHQGIKPFYYYEDENGATSIRIETVKQQKQPADNIAGRRTMLIRELADRIVQNRLDDLLQRKEGVMHSADISSGYYLQQIHFTEISAKCGSGQWRKTLTTLEHELRRALQYGFMPSELRRAKKEKLALLQRDANESNTRESNDIARDILASLGNWHVFQSPQQQLSILEPILNTTTLEQVNEAFRETWDADHRLIIVTGDAELSGGQSTAEEKILAAFHDSRRMALKAPIDRKASAFPYLQTPKSTGRVISHENLEDLGIEQVSFGNGTKLLLKQTELKENQVQVALAFGWGKASEPLDQTGLAELTQEVVNASGFGAMDQMALERALAGRLARIQLEVREDMFVVKGQSITGELPLLMQLLYTFLKDPGFRPEARELVLKRFEQRFRALECDVAGIMRLKGKQFLAGGDSRFGMPTLKQLRRRTLDQIKAWYGRQLRESPLEVSIIGDFHPPSAISLANRYFGTLPARQSKQPNLPRQNPVFPAGQTVQLTADSAIPKSIVVVAYPTDDFWNISRTRRLAILSEVLSERLRTRIRESLGAAYSPFAFNHSYRAYPGYGLLQIYLNVDPAQTELLVDEVKRITAQMNNRSISQDEFRRALDPVLTRIKDLRQTNDYWIDNVLVGASRYPQQLEWCRTIEKDYAAIRAADVTALARDYLEKSKAATIVIQPGQIAQEQTCPVESETPPFGIGFQSAPDCPQTSGDTGRPQ